MKLPAARLLGGPTIVSTVSTTRHISIKLLQVPAVAGEPRDLARGNGANFAEADLRHHPLKTGALDAACSGTAKIIIDHLDLGPAKCSQAIAHGVLQRAALPIVCKKRGRRRWQGARLVRPAAHY